MYMKDKCHQQSMLMRVLQFINDEEQSPEPKEDFRKVIELIRTSLMFEDVNDCDDISDEEQECVPIEMVHYPQQQTIRKPYQTFTEFLSSQKKSTQQSEQKQKLSEQKPTHTRGPSKIQEILNDLQATVTDDIKRLTTYLSDSDKKSYQDFQEPCYVESAKVKKRRRKSRFQKYFLDIIEEQSNDQYTPERSMLGPGLETIHSVPCFGENSRMSVDFMSQAKSNNDSDDYANPAKFEQILLELHRIKSYRQRNHEEEAILASWNKMCTEIIRKNLLPVSLNIEMIQNQLEYKQQSSRRYQLADNLHRENETSNSNHFHQISLRFARKSSSALAALHKKIINNLSKIINRDIDQIWVQLVSLTSIKLSQSTLQAPDPQFKVFDHTKIIRIQAQVRGYLTRKHKQFVESPKFKQVIPQFSFAELNDHLPGDLVKIDWPKVYLPIIEEQLKLLKPFPLELKQAYFLREGIFQMGDFEKELKVGAGRLYDEKLGLYEGSFQEGLKSGFGRQIGIDGSIYEGNFSQNVFNGEGFYRNSQGYSYNGQWMMGEIHGEGTEITDKYEYKGTFVLGAKCGFGEIKFHNGDRYLGEFQNDKFEGFGTHFYADVLQYEGDWLNNEIHGKGCFSWVDGRKYIGSYRYGLKEGQGEFIFSNGSKYRGPWKDGKQHGVGVMISDLGDQREGEWLMGRRIKWR